MNELLECMGSARTTRWFLDRPVGDDVIQELIWAATRASSAHNSQPWSFVVVKSPEQRARIGAAIQAAVAANDPMPVPQDDTDRIIDAGVRNLFAHLDEVPVLIVIVATDSYPHERPNAKFMWSATGGAAQNLVVAARSLGLGTTPTMLHTLADAEIRAILGVPASMTITTLLPVGYPARPFGPVKRRPLDEVIHHDVWSAKDGVGA